MTVLSGKHLVIFALSLWTARSISHNIMKISISIILEINVIFPLLLWTQRNIFLILWTPRIIFFTNMTRHSISPMHYGYTKIFPSSL